MKERVSQLLGKKNMKGLRVSTFHTLGLDIIRHELKTLELKSGFSIYDSSDSLALIKELMRKAFGDHGDQPSKCNGVFQVGKMPLCCLNKPLSKQKMPTTMPPPACTRPITITFALITPLISMT